MQWRAAFLTSIYSVIESVTYLFEAQFSWKSSSCFGADICFHFSLFSELSTSYLFSFGGVAVVAKPVPDRVDREFYSAALRAPDLKSWPRPML